MLRKFKVFFLPPPQKKITEIDNFETPNQGTIRGMDQHFQDIFVHPANYYSTVAGSDDTGSDKPSGRDY
jgi:CO dehydrogenase/acetyl-CoA synthase delta subunit